MEAVPDLDRMTRRGEELRRTYRVDSIVGGSAAIRPFKSPQHGAAFEVLGSARRRLMGHLSHIPPPYPWFYRALSTSTICPSDVAD